MTLSLKKLILLTLLWLGSPALWAQTDHLPGSAVSVQQQSYLLNPADTLNRQLWLYYGTQKADRMVRYPELLHVAGVKADSGRVNNRFQGQTVLTIGNSYAVFNVLQSALAASFGFTNMTSAVNGSLLTPGYEYAVGDGVRRSSILERVYGAFHNTAAPLPNVLFLPCPEINDYSYGLYNGLQAGKVGDKISPLFNSSLQVISSSVTGATYAGALQWIIDYVRRQSPATLIIIANGVQTLQGQYQQSVNAARVRDQEGWQWDFCGTTLSVANRNAVPNADFFHTSGITYENNAYTTCDKVHPSTQLGWPLLISAGKGLFSTLGGTAYAGVQPNQIVQRDSVGRIVLLNGYAAKQESNGDLYASGTGGNIYSNQSGGNGYNGYVLQRDGNTYFAIELGPSGDLFVTRNQNGTFKDSTLNINRLTGRVSMGAGLDVKSGAVQISDVNPIINLNQQDTLRGHYSLLRFSRAGNEYADLGQNQAGDLFMAVNDNTGFIRTDAFTLQRNTGILLLGYGVKIRGDALIDGNVSANALLLKATDGTQHKLQLIPDGSGGYQFQITDQ